MAAKRGPKMGSPTHEEVLARVKACLQENSFPWVETWQVAEVFDATDRTVRNRLNDLAEAGEIDVRQYGGSAKLWYISDRYSPPVSARSPTSESQ